MKKIISLIIAIVMLISVAMPAVYAADATEESTPIIYLRGNGEPIYFDNGEGERINTDIDQVLGASNVDKDELINETVNIIVPFLAGGLLQDEWDECRKAIYDAISPLFDQTIFGGDGNPRYGTTIHWEAQWSNEHPNVTAQDWYSSTGLVFHYDWRCDPYDNADLLAAFVDRVLEATGKKQVSFVSRCMGGTLLNAYLERYGHEGKVKNALYGDTLAGGSTILSKLFSGKVVVDGKNTQRYLGQLDLCGELGIGVGFALPGLIEEIATTTLDFFTQINVTDDIGDGIEKLFNDVYIMILPALMHATGYATAPNYWACVREEDFDEAIQLMFGEEGSEAREYYAGLIEKITYYREHVTSREEKFFEDMEAYAHIGAVAKYGFLNVSLLDDNDIQSDALASLEHATFGAKAAKIGETLSDDYIAERVAEGYGDYISDDKVVDMSTSVIKDTCWVFKNAHHNHEKMIFVIADEFCNGTNVTVETSSFPRFSTYYYETGSWEEMTQENCGDLEFITRAEKEPTTETRLAAGLRFFTMILNFIVKLFKGEVSFDSLGSLFGK